MKKLHKSQWEPKKYDPFLIEYEEARRVLPYTDGLVEYLTSTGIKTKKLTEAEWNALRTSTALQRLTLV